MKTFFLDINASNALRDIFKIDTPEIQSSSYQDFIAHKSGKLTIHHFLISHLDKTIFQDAILSSLTLREDFAEKELKNGPLGQYAPSQIALMATLPFCGTLTENVLNRLNHLHTTTVYLNKNPSYEKAIDSTISAVLKVIQENAHSL